MTKPVRRLLLWSPRVLGILMGVFLGVFALDAFGEGKTFLEALPAFLLHLAPALFVLGVVVVSWRWEWVGGVLFVALAAFYAVPRLGRLDWTWMATIGGPLFLVGVLYWLSWRSHADLHSRG